MDEGRRNTSHGFTLVELALVAIIVAVLVGISTPVFRRTYYDLQLEETAYNIAKFVHYARAKAIAERVRTKLNFDFEIRRYWLTIDKNSERPNQFEPLKGRLGKFYKIPHNIKLDGEKTFLIFYPNGRSENFKLYLKLQKVGGEKIKVIDIKGGTGEARVEDFKG